MGNSAETRIIENCRKNWLFQSTSAVLSLIIFFGLKPSDAKDIVEGVDSATEALVFRNDEDAQEMIIEAIGGMD